MAPMLFKLAWQHGLGTATPTLPRPSRPPDESPPSEDSTRQQVHFDRLCARPLAQSKSVQARVPQSLRRGECPRIVRWRRRALLEDSCHTKRVRRIGNRPVERVWRQARSQWQQPASPAGSERQSAATSCRFARGPARVGWTVEVLPAAGDATARASQKWTPSRPAWCGQPSGAVPAMRPRPANSSSRPRASWRRRNRAACKVVCASRTGARVQRCRYAWRGSTGCTATSFCGKSHALTGFMTAIHSPTSAVWACKTVSTRTSMATRRTGIALGSRTAKPPPAI